MSLNLGGSELVAVELSEFAAAAGHRVTVIAAHGPLSERIRACGAAHLDWSIGRKRLGTLRYISQLRTWLAHERPDVLHVHSRLPAWICDLALRRLDPSVHPAYITSMQLFRLRVASCAGHPLSPFGLRRASSSLVTCHLLLVTCYLLLVTCY